jgi:hypothetical protein
MEATSLNYMCRKGDNMKKPEKNKKMMAAAAKIRKEAKGNKSMLKAAAKIEREA